AVREVDERLNGVAHGGGERLAGYELDAASAVLIASLARLDRDAVRRIAIVRVDVVVATAKRHDPRGPSDERARVLEFLRDDKGVRVREAEALEQPHVLAVIDAVVEQRGGRELRRV